MAVATPDDRELITALSRQIIDEIAPEETDLFDELISDYFADPTPPDLSTAAADDPLGFGLGELMVAVTPAAAAVAAAAIPFIVATMTQAAGDAGAEQVRSWLKRRLRGEGDHSRATPQLPPEAMKNLRRIMDDAARQYGMDDAQSEAMVNVVLVKFLLGEDAASGQKPTKILFLAVNPKGTAQLRLDEEIRTIDEALRKSDFRQRFQIESQWAVRVSDLQGLLLRHSPDIVHFSGHSSSGLILEDIDGQPREVPPDALADLFGILKDTVRCVVLNACYSHGQATAISHYVDAVIGMSDQIDDEASVAFAAAFYQALGYGKDVPTAFKLGVSQLRIYDLPSASMPQLLVR